VQIIRQSKVYDVCVVGSGAGATLALAAVGALTGFLVWNAPPARVYLGDAGSYLIGTALAMLLVGVSQRHAAVISGDQPS